VRVLILCALLGATAIWVKGTDTPQRNSLASTRMDWRDDDCRHHLDMEQSSFSSIMTKEELVNISGHGLSLQAGKVDAVHVIPSDKPIYQLKLCTQVDSVSQTLSTQLLDETALRADKITVSLIVPRPVADSVAATVLIVKAPKDASLSVHAMNGEVSLSGFVGMAKIRTGTGQISAKESSGSLDFSSESGGITIWDCGGDMRAITGNGGMTLILASRWTGKGLLAYTQNGGLTIATAKDLRVGLEVIGHPHLSVTCVGTACENTRRLVDNGRQVIRLGSDRAQVHVETMSGAVTVLNRR
jgi:hypothetical protein